MYTVNAFFHKTSHSVPLLYSIHELISITLIKANHILFQIFDFSLTEEEMKAIEALNKNIRFVELLM